MKLELDRPWMEPFNPAIDVRVLVACGDASTAEQACALLHCVGRDCGSEGRLIYRWWNFEVLAINSLRELASFEAAAADLIIIAAREGRKLPCGIADWMARWLELRNGRRGALVALLESDREASGASGTPEAVFSKLKAAAAEGCLDFFASRINPGQAGGIDAWFSKTTRRFILTSITRAPHLEARRKERNPQPRPPSFRAGYAGYN